jgi:hypothetical protein
MGWAHEVDHLLSMDDQDARGSCSIRRRRLDGRIDDLETFNAPLSVSEPATNGAHLQLHSHPRDR